MKLAKVEAKQSMIDSIIPEYIKAFLLNSFGTNAICGDFSHVAVPLANSKVVPERSEDDMIHDMQR